MRNMHDINELLFRLLDNNINDGEFLALKNWLDSGAAAKSYYCQFMQDCGEMSVRMLAGIRAEDETFNDDSQVNFDLSMWEQLARYEKAAPEAEVLQEEPQRELIQKVVYPPRAKRKLSKLHIFTLLNAAAMVLFFVFLRFTPPKGGVEVATLVDQIDSKWAQIDNIPKSGCRLWTNEMPLHLQSGIVRIQYDDGVEVMIEGPAVFEISKSAMFMEYGRLYSRVSDSGLGFTVRTPTTHFVDLGTEFGVQAEVDGSSELHVIKGKVQLFAGPKGGAKTGAVVTENNAINYSVNQNRVMPVPVRKNAFVRGIDSKTGMIWRGQDRMSLAGLLVGQAGFGDSAGVKIDFNRRVATGSSDRASGNALDRPQYVLLGELPFVDGAFVPDGGEGDVQIASDGLTYNKFPNSSSELIKSANDNSVEPIGNEGPLSQPKYFVLEPEPQPKDQPSCFRLHCNTGVTFDLAAIRKSNPGVRISGFKSGFRIADGFNNRLGGDILILVDGKERFTHLNYSRNDGPLDIEFNINDGDRFLTIVCTEGASTGNWPLFTDPILVLEAAQN